MNIIQKIKCLIGCHRTGVYGHAENKQDEISDPSLEDRYDLKYEYYLCCVACNTPLAWDYRYRLGKYLKRTYENREEIK